MDLEDTKENIQPLRTGRNIEQLEYALESPECWEEDRKMHEEAIEQYDGDDPLSVWFEYVQWFEQTNPSNTKPALMNDAIRRCVVKFENDPRYMQDRRFIQLCIKYIDTQPKPEDLYSELFARGVGTLCADLYIAWAYYYDAADNFSKTEEVFQKGLAAGAQPKEELKQAHTAFGFSMSQRMLHKDEGSKLKFQASLAERRTALTSLRTTRKKHVGSIRTGLAIKSVKPGIVNQENVPVNPGARNAPASALVFTDEREESDAGPSIVHPFSSVHTEPENIIEAARLAKSHPTSAHKKSSVFAKSIAPSFSIPMDEESKFEPIPLLVDNYNRGVQLSSKFHSRNNTQTPFDLSVCVGDPNERAVPRYDKIRLYCKAAEKQEYSPDELRAYRYYERRQIKNKLTETLNRVWGRGFEYGIRLHPLHRRTATAQPVAPTKIRNPSIDECDPNIKTRLQEMYANSEEEKSIEELLVAKWIEGRIQSGVDRRYHDDVCPVDMDETHVESKRISMGVARYSMAPALATGENGQRPKMRQRQSIYPSGHVQLGQVASCITEEAEDESYRTDIERQTDPDKPESISRKRISNEELQQKVCKREDTKPTPAKGIMPYDSEMMDRAGPATPPVPLAPPKINIFVEDGDEEGGEGGDMVGAPKATGTERAPEQPYYPNDSCSTQMFNFFVKNISTPLGPMRKQPLLGGAQVADDIAATGDGPRVTAKRMVVYEDDDKPAQERESGDENSGADGGKALSTLGAPVAAGQVNDENVPPVLDSMTPPSISGSSACNSTHSNKQLSTIMERTETSTAGSSSATKSPLESQPLSPDTIDAGTPAVKSTDEVQRVSPTQQQQGRESVFKVPYPTEEPPATGNPVGVFCIHVDSTETMANIPLLLKRDIPTGPAAAAAATKETAPDADKENQLIVRSNAAVPIPAPPSSSASDGTGGFFNLADDPTFTGQRNISQMVQRDLEFNSMASFRLGTERTNTVPLPLLKPFSAIAATSSVASNGSEKLAPKPSPSSAESQPPPKKNSSFLDLLDTTFSPKPTAPKAIVGTSGSGTSTHPRSSFNLSDLMKTPEPKGKPASSSGSDVELKEAPSVACVPLQMLSPDPLMVPIKVENSINLDVSLELPKFSINCAAPINPQPLIKIDLDEFPSPLPPTMSAASAGQQNDRASMGDINTAVFSLNINRPAMNSTIIKEGFRTPSPKQQSGLIVVPAAPIAVSGASSLVIADVRGGISTASASLLMPPPAITGPFPSESNFCENDADLSIYHPRPVISQEAERWEEVEECLVAPTTGNEYQRKAIDMDCTMQQITAHVESVNVDPFDKQLLEAFLDRLDFTSYLDDVATCTTVHKVQPLKKAARIEVNDGTTFEVYHKIGQGTYGTIFCANQVDTGKQFALKQERPANLWEYYICLELRSRITNPDILPGFMSIDYAIIGNNASIFVSPFSPYGNLLDVCNTIHQATNRNVDEFIAMILSAQILSIVDHLHSCQIIHADIKPDNFLLMAPIDMGSVVPCIQLIDFGVSIDMKLFQEDVKFNKVITTEGFTCIEMMENRPWTYQPDLYGVAGTTHVMLFGKYMQVQKQIVNWQIKSAMPRYFKKAIWENYFTALLNIRDCDHLPNLQQLRTTFLEEIAQNEKYIRSKVVEFNRALVAAGK
ncbi:uncharacterized protein LOC126571418 [Anopheles aquasalis]|uniref:uncharacterized protein LOC126571418 n=1 Tax=Anopheles aquasalis TaxID=42839 RepID=UPI00215B0B64|nr:uncharacterized protein LOC126571418 [Anopheles aquasalis]